MKKTLTVLTVMALGAGLACLLRGARRRERGGPARAEATDVVSDAGEVTAAAASRISRSAHETDSGATPVRAASSCGATEAAPRVRDAGLAASLCVHDSRWPSARRLLPGIERGGRLVYRLIRKVSTVACLCAAGLGLVRRLFAHGPPGRAADSGRETFSNKERVLVAGLVGLAFLLRLSALRLRQDTLTPDGVYYATLGRSLAAGKLKEGLSTFWPPLYPLLVGGASLVSRDVEAGGRLVSVTAGSLLIVPVYLLIRLVHGEDAAFVGALLAAVHPVLIHYSTLLLTDSTYTLLFTFALLAGLNALSGRGRGAFFAAGSALGACYLTRPEAVGYAALMPVLTLCVRLSGNHLAPSEILPDLLCLAAGFLLLALPYLLFLRRATGGWTISDKLRAHVHSGESWARRWYGLQEGRRTTLADRLYAGVMQEGVSSESRSPLLPDAQSLRRMIGRSVKALTLELRLLAYYLIPLQLMVLTGLGLFKAEWLKEIYLLLFLSATLAGYALCPDDVSDRLLVPLIPLSLCWAARGVDEVERRLVSLSKRVKIPKLSLPVRTATVRRLVWAGLLVSTLPWAAYTLTRELPSRLEHRRAGAWVKGHSETPALVMATAPYVAFYARARHLYLPAEEYPIVVEHARRHRVDYLVIDEEVISEGHWGHNEYAGLRFLLDGRSDHPGLKLVYGFDGVPNRKILIFTLA